MAELIWSGRIHLGDEPGIYGNGVYAGLTAELPIQVEAFFEGGQETNLAFIVQTDSVKVYHPYHGHLIRIKGYQLIQGTAPQEWRSVVLAERLISDDSQGHVEIDDLQGCRDLSIQLQVNTRIAPGLYDDFLWTGLLLDSTTHFASLGFHFRKAQPGVS